MMRLLTFLILIAGFCVAVDWFMQHPGSMQVTWLGYEITLNIAILAVALLVLVVLVSFFSVLFSRILTWPARRRMRVRQRTIKRGLAQLTRGVTALAMGDEDAAEEALKKAVAALPGEPLPQLLTAQLLQRQGKLADAQLQFHALMKHPVTAELATRRLIEQHVTRHEWREAAHLAEQARKDSPRDRWLILMLIDLYARDRNTTQILALTEGWQWQSPLTKEERHHLAALAYYLAAQNATAPRLKAQQLRHAVGYAPEFLPAVIEYAHALIDTGDRRGARKWLLDAWNAKPSTALIEPILASLGEETPRQQSRLVKPFLKGELTAAHYLLTARQALLANEPVRAREALNDALDLEENKEVLTLIAEQERRTKGNDAANSWIERALNAPQSAGWVCSSCASVHAVWHAHCPSCERFDTLHYARPEGRSTSIELMPPLI